MRRVGTAVAVLLLAVSMAALLGVSSSLAVPPTMPPHRGGPADVQTIHLPPSVLFQQPKQPKQQQQVEEDEPHHVREQTTRNSEEMPAEETLVEVQARAAATEAEAVATLEARVTAEDDEEAAEQVAAVVTESLARLPEDQRVVAHMAQSFLAGVLGRTLEEAARLAEEAERPKAFVAPNLLEVRGDEGDDEEDDEDGSNSRKQVLGTVNLMRAPRFAEARVRSHAAARHMVSAAARARSRAENAARLSPDLTGSPEFLELARASRHQRGFFKKAWTGIKKVVKKGVSFVKKVFSPKKPEPAQKPAAPATKPAAAAKEADKAPTRQDIEDCFACKMVWAQVEMDVGDARYAEDVQASFEHNCMDAQKSTIFYAACEDMYDDVYAMTDDYMSSKYNVDQICARAKLCKGGSAGQQ